MWEICLRLLWCCLQACLLGQPHQPNALLCYWSTQFHSRSSYRHADREVFQGHYGPWTIDPEDVAEVWSYRIGLTAAVAGTHVEQQPETHPELAVATMTVKLIHTTRSYLNR